MKLFKSQINGCSDINVTFMSFPNSDVFDKNTVTFSHNITYMVIRLFLIAYDNYDQYLIKVIQSSARENPKSNIMCIPIIVIYQ